MANEIWQEEEKKFLAAIKGVKIPNYKLDDVPFITPKSEQDFEAIPESGGCYWIWTNEPVLHSLHKNKTPAQFDNGEIIYNGIAKDNVKGRAKHHLMGDVEAGWSGISVDVFFGETTSHRKKAFSEKGKVPYINEKTEVKRAIKDKGLKKGDFVERLKPIRSKDDFFKINLSEKEKEELKGLEYEKIYFRNGIDITEEKHQGFEFRVYYITGLASLYLDFIEKKWREDNGLPRLCSYSSGR